MDIDKVMERIKKYQELSMVHPLTCGNNSMHNNLEPRIQDEQVILFCKDCDYTQSHIPDMFKQKDFDHFLETQKRIQYAVENHFHGFEDKGDN